MKKYVSPDYEIEKFTIGSVLTTSGPDTYDDGDKFQF